MGCFFFIFRYVHISSFAIRLIVTRSGLGGSDTVRAVLHEKNLIRSCEIITDCLNIIYLLSRHDTLPRDPVPGSRRN
jgi:hypothetical protein